MSRLQGWRGRMSQNRQSMPPKGPRTERPRQAISACWEWALDKTRRRCCERWATKRCRRFRDPGGEGASRAAISVVSPSEIPLAREKRDGLSSSSIVDPRGLVWNPVAKAVALARSSRSTTQPVGFQDRGRRRWLGRGLGIQSGVAGRGVLDRYRRCSDGSRCLGWCNRSE